MSVVGARAAHVADLARRGIWTALARVTSAGDGRRRAAAGNGWKGAAGGNGRGHWSWAAGRSLSRYSRVRGGRRDPDALNFETGATRPAPPRLPSRRKSIRHPCKFIDEGRRH